MSRSVEDVDRREDIQEIPHKSLTEARGSDPLTLETYGQPISEY